MRSLPRLHSYTQQNKFNTIPRNHISRTASLFDKFGIVASKSYIAISARCHGIKVHFSLLSFLNTDKSPSPDSTRQRANVSIKHSTIVHTTIIFSLAFFRIFNDMI